MLRYLLSASLQNELGIVTALNSALKFATSTLI
jgi:hypothetical protein